VSPKVHIRGRKVPRSPVGKSKASTTHEGASFGTMACQSRPYRSWSDVVMTAQEAREEHSQRSNPLSAVRQYCHVSWLSAINGS